MKFISTVRTAVLVCSVCFVLTVGVNAQDTGLGNLADVPDLGEIRGVTSFKGDEREFLAVWYYAKQQLGGGSLLVILERKQDKYNEVFRFDDSAADGAWERIIPLYPGLLTGLILSASQISGDDDVWLIALVDSKFKVVHHGESSEFWDINEDGYPEIFDSMWPDGDGQPETTTVYVWDGSVYRRVIEVKYNLRLSKRVRDAVSKVTRLRPIANK